MIKAPVESIEDSLTEFFGFSSSDGVQLRLQNKEREIPAYRIDDRFVLFGQVDGSHGLPEIAERLEEDEPAFHDNVEAYEILYVLRGPQISSDEREVVTRGVSAVDFHTGIAEIIGLPDGWRTQQASLIDQALQPLRVGDEVRLARLEAVVENTPNDALAWLKDSLFDWQNVRSELFYLRAEAGKGKSTLLAEVTRQQSREAEGPLPLYVPLRAIQRGSGISWEGMVSPVGVVGNNAELLSRAVRSGLVTVLLDGLDEIAGRYDPSVVQQVVKTVLNHIQTTNSRVLLSGRTTEASNIPEEDAIEAGLELPDVNEAAFENYCNIVVEHVADEWPKIQKRIPEPPLTQENIADVDSSPEQRRKIVEWLKRVFGDLGKERSLFFVQSLACIGRHYQLAGNQPFFVPGRDEPATRPPLYDVCDLAAALACVREQDKIEEMARDIFTPREQVDLVTWLALRASAEESLQSELPQPNELAEKTFRIDPVNQNELFTAVVRQLQKHALLFATNTESVRAGDWRPQFISEWVKSALLVRAWRQRSNWDSTELISKIVARAEKAQQAFRYIIPDMVEEEELDNLVVLGDKLVNEADSGSPEACGNFWSLYASLPSDTRHSFRNLPERTAEFTDLSELSANNVEFPESFGGSLLYLVNSDFSECVFDGHEFHQCELNEVRFQNCEISNSEFHKCDGPVVFEGCIFENVKFRDGQAESLPVYIFEDCDFDKDCALIQRESPGPGDTYGKCAVFKSSVARRSAEELIVGEWSGFDRFPVDGLSESQEELEYPPEVRALRALLKLFFPRQAGPGQLRQARGYIRESSIGRGVWPDGTPDSGTLRSILLSEGFSTGGREGHVYAPWSSITPEEPDAYEVRSEYSRFLQEDELGPHTKRLLEKLRREGDW